MHFDNNQTLINASETREMIKFEVVEGYIPGWVHIPLRFFLTDSRTRADPLRHPA